jgi:hypothetical protein
MSLSLGLYARINAAIAQTNTIDLTFWEVDPPRNENEVIAERGVASLQIQHLYQLYLELEIEMDSFDTFDDVMKIQSAISALGDLMDLLVADMLHNPNYSYWVLTQDGKLFECDEIRADEKTEPKKVRPDYLRVVPTSN